MFSQGSFEHRHLTRAVLPLAINHFVLVPSVVGGGVVVRVILLEMRSDIPRGCGRESSAAPVVQATKGRNARGDEGFLLVRVWGRKSLMVRT